ncbi:MAG: TadE family type IV pilus minor pilin [Propionibacteriaceae bacterium]|nr:TadE family type IV pilus minor pilin [Propionibacteriaceae bacterium]
MVTVETAFACLVMAVVLGAVLVVGGAAFVLGQCQVTANEVARQAARGDAPAVQRALEDAPPGARVEQRHEGGAVVVEVHWEAALGEWRYPLVARAHVLGES